MVSRPLIAQIRNERYSIESSELTCKNLQFVWWCSTINGCRYDAVFMNPLFDLFFFLKEKIMRINDAGDALYIVAECCFSRVERETSPSSLLRAARGGGEVYLNGALSMTMKRMEQMNGPESRCHGISAYLAGDN